ncbi:uncharacterized protein LOC118180984 [Stegodyphus dumicola]|uniref:uncharacterized protein LOC118180984 n=1 Tax=Stegodyphus dumicola TaxID=202533 RepID=UPI0015A7D715|nr:uncharacterized protein LOC118180984 [Stegodyphus dumicola]
MINLRENFWILKSRKSIRNIIRKCVRCKRFVTQRVEVEPRFPSEDQVRVGATFEVVGVDLAGPLYLREGSKAWIVLYTCAIYRAIHLELVTSLSTETFIQSLRRFIARRGRPYVIYSDNGTNFVGTNSVLGKLIGTPCVQLLLSKGYDGSSTLRPRPSGKVGGRGLCKW